MNSITNLLLRDINHSNLKSLILSHAGCIIYIKNQYISSYKILFHIFICSIILHFDDEDATIMRRELRAKPRVKRCLGWKTNACQTHGKINFNRSFKILLWEESLYSHLICMISNWYCNIWVTEENIVWNFSSKYLFRVLGWTEDMQQVLSLLGSSLTDTHQESELLNTLCCLLTIPFQHSEVT